MTDSAVLPKAPEKMPAKEQFIRAMISGLRKEPDVFYERRGDLYFDTAIYGGRELVRLGSSQFVAFILQLAHKSHNVLLRSTDAELIAEHVSMHAYEVARPLSSDPRSCWQKNVLWINPGWRDGRLIKVADGKWTIEAAPGRLFAPLPITMAMPMPVAGVAASAFSGIVSKGITSFGEFHAFFCATLATMLMPMDDVQPILILTGEGAKGKTTTMKLMTQLVDPDQGNECMIISEDQRNLLVTCQYRKTLGLDNASRLPIPEDLLSQMFAGGTFNERKLYSNNELSQTRIERMRVVINGVSPDFSKSDFFTKALFLEQPVVTKTDAKGENFDSLSIVESDWRALLPQALGALLTVIAEGLPHYQSWVARRIAEGRRPSARVRFVEFTVMGEAFSRAMGFGEDVFSEQVYTLNNRSKDDAVGKDECTQFLLSWLEGERGAQNHAFAGWGDDGVTTDSKKEFPKAEEYLISISDLYTELRDIAQKRGYSVFSMNWLKTLRGFTNAIERSVANLEQAGWIARRVPGGVHKRKWQFMKKNGNLSPFPNLL